MQRKIHPINVAAAKLQEIGVQPARVQGFLEAPGVDGRHVCLFDPDGAYYLFGFDIPGCSPENREKIQVIFLRVPATAAWIADQIGWQLEKVENLPVVGPRLDDVEWVDFTPSAIFSIPAQH